MTTTLLLAAALAALVAAGATGWILGRRYEANRPWGTRDLRARLAAAGQRLARQRALTTGLAVDLARRTGGEQQ